jgi:predicted dehydrogenase
MGLRLSRLLRAGVVGAGVFGSYHARKYATLPGVMLAGVFDPDAARGEALAQALGVRTFDSLEALLAAVDVLTVASPGATHAGVAKAALAAGKSVYVEKPLAVTVADADALVAQAAAAGLTLACGHQERVVFRAMGLLDIPERPTLLEALRRQPWGERNLDVSCVLDLMIHDIDLALTLGPAAPRIVAAGGRIAQGPLLDAVRADVTLDDGTQLTFDASRTAAARERRMRVVFPSGEVEIDFITRAFSNTTPFPLNPDFIDTPAGQDPLGVSVSAFLAAVRGEAARPAVTGEEAARALDLALTIERAAAR